MGRQEVGVGVVAAHDGTHEDVGVAGDELGGGVQDDVGPEVKRTLAQRCRERRVDHGDRAALPGSGRDRRDVSDDDERVGDRLHPDHVGAVGGRQDGAGVVGRDHADVEAAVRSQAVEDVPDAEVGHGGQHHGAARRHEGRDRGRGRQARGERHGPAAIQCSERRLERAPGGVAVAAVLESRVVDVG